MRSFLENLNLPGGHMVWLTLLMIFGMLAHKWGVPKADDIVLGAFTALLAVMNANRKQDPPSAS